MVEGLKPLTARLGTELSRDQILEIHARHESSQQAHTPAKRYSDLLATVYRRIAEEWGIPATWDECLAYGNSVKNRPAFSDSAGALSISRNTTSSSFSRMSTTASFAASNEKLQVEFDRDLYGEDIGSTSRRIAISTTCSTS